MLLAVDVGNTNISLGLIKGEEIVGSFRLITKTERTSDELGVMVYELLQRAGVKPEDIEDEVISSVVPKNMYTL